MIEGGRPMSEGERSFTIQGSGTGFKGGRYRSKTDPLAAARKAGARLYRNLSERQIKLREKKGKKTIKFILKETTQGSTKQTLFFKVQRISLNPPVKRTLADGKVIETLYRYEVQKCGPNEKLE